MFKIIGIGELSGWTKQGFEDYAKRLPRPWDVKHIQIPTPNRGKKSQANQAMQMECKKILSHLSPEDTLIILDQRGKQYTSESFSQTLVSLLENKSICFVLGGPDGLSDEIQKRATLKLSLSQAVLPHALARIVLIEQIYRAYTLSINHPYHRA